MLQGPPVLYLTFYWQPPILVSPILIWPPVPTLQSPLQLLDWIGAHYRQLHPNCLHLGPLVLHPRKSASRSLSTGQQEEGTAYPRSPRTLESLTFQPHGRDLCATPPLRVSSTRTRPEKSVLEHSSSSFFTYVCNSDSNLSHFDQTFSSSANIEFNLVDVLTMSCSKGLMNPTSLSNPMSSAMDAAISVP